MPAFEIRRDPGGEGSGFVRAQDACTNKGLSLCTETQHERACAVRPAIGTVETWTATADGDGLVVRGGDGGCASRKIARGSESVPERAPVCCERAIAVRTDSANPAFLSTVEGKLLAFESALGRRNVPALAPHLDDSVAFFAKRYDRGALLSQYTAYFRQYPDAWMVHEACDVVVAPDHDSWSADCSTLSYRAGTIAVVTTRFVRGGAEFKIRSIEETAVRRPFSAP